MLDQFTTRIPLPHGRYALVDAADCSRVANFSWRRSGNGYVIGQHCGKSILLHRLILDAPGGVEVDHIDGDPLNNRRTNLRLVTRSENLQNRQGLNSNNSSGFRGAAWMPSVRRYRARLMVQGKDIHLGLFDTLEEAARAVKIGRRKYMTHAEPLVAEAEQIVSRR